MGSSPISSYMGSTGYTGYPAVSLTDALIGWWTFDEGDGQTLYDSSGNGYFGTWRGTPAGRTDITPPEGRTLGGKLQRQG